ncbi:MAG: hypothetical protein CL610_01705 [Anaerolineaceae bacterium]|nr:hypothetical protein [Anaerolineaceae bacterium]
MTNEHTHAKQENKREHRAQKLDVPDRKELVFDQNPVLKLQSTIGNQGVQSLLNAGHLGHLRHRPTNTLPAVRGAIQPKREEEQEEVVEEDLPEFSGVKSPAGAFPPGPPDGESPVTLRAAGQTHPHIQRELNDEQRDLWNANDGDQIVSDIKAAAEAWKDWRKQPITYEGMPKGENVNLSGLSELVRLNGTVFGQHAAQEIGGENIKYLNEMAAFVPRFNLLIGVVPGVSAVKANHKYEMRAIESENVMMKSWPVGQLEVIYSNAFGWSWTKMLKGSFMSVEVGFGFGAEKEKGGVKKGPKAGLGFNIPGQISINGKAIAKHGAYWGLDDLVGAVHVVNGPSVKGVIAGFGKKAASGGGIQFVGNGAPLSPLNFENFASEFTLDTETPKKPGDLKGAEISISIVEQGAGAVWSAGGDSFAIPEPEPQAQMSEKTWRYNIGPFETGSSALPGDTQTYLDMIKQDLDAKKEEIEAQRDIFEQLSIDPAFKVDFMIEGYASRPWQTAGNDAQRKEKNKELSQARADAVASQVNGMFAEVLGGITSVGRGAAVRIVEHDIRFEGGEMVRNKTTEKILSEETNSDAIEAEIRKREEQYKKDFPWMTDEEIKQQVRRSLGTSSEADDPFIRRVVVTAMWRGYEIQWGGANQSPGSVPRGN